jgi:hypothetical protein
MTNCTLSFATCQQYKTRIINKDEQRGRHKMETGEGETKTTVGLCVWIATTMTISALKQLQYLADT